MAYSQILKYNEMQTFDSASLTGTYQNIGVALANPASLIKLINNSSAVVTVSTDGVTDHDVLPGQSHFVYDCTTNKAHASAGAFIPKGTQFMVKGSSSTGLIYLVSLYIHQS